MEAWIVPAFYVCFLTIVVSLRDRVQLYRVLRLRSIHNVGLSTYSLFVFLWMLTKLKRERFDRALICNAREGAAPFWCISKFAEWFDTILLVARYKRITSLHLFHHATAPLITILNTRNGVPTPLYDVGTTLNALVHFFMYVFYADPVNLRFLKKFITRIQILQHAVVVALLCFTLCMPSCDAPLEIYGFSLLCYFFYLCLFVHFYTTRYSGAADGAVG